MTERFTHNLKLAVMNKDGSIMSGEHANHILSQVYAEIANIVVRKKINWSETRSKIDYAVLWSRKLLKNNAERMFMGDLFTHSMVCDALLHKATGKILREIEETIWNNLEVRWRHEVEEQNLLRTKDVVRSVLDSHPLCSRDHETSVQDIDKNWKIVFHISKIIDAPPDYRYYIDMFYNIILN